MAEKLRWGILSTANIGVKSVIPAVQASSNGEVVALSSRREDRAREVADELSIPEAYGSYEALLELAQLDCGLALERRKYVEIVGSEGSLELPDAFTSKGETALILEQHPDQEVKTHQVPGADPYQKMAEHFTQCVLEGKPLRYPVGEAAANLRTVEALYRSARKNSA